MKKKRSIFSLLLPLQRSGGGAVLLMPDEFVWVDLCAPTEADLHVMAEELGLHQLAVQDALGEFIGKVERGELGVKSGRGFFDWNDTRYFVAKDAGPSR